MRAQAECLHFDVEARRFRATSPIIGGATAHYGPAWAQALGRTDFVALRAEIDDARRRGLHRIADAGRRARGGLAAPAGDGAEGRARHQRRRGERAPPSRSTGADGADGFRRRLRFRPRRETRRRAWFWRSRGRSAPSPQQIALVGDTLHDLECARAAGAIAVAVLSGVASREDLAPHADYRRRRHRRIAGARRRMATAPELRRDRAKRLTFI